ncbi:MAG: (2Fe-2S)-binding protein [Opitutaceae bacterium]|jgi:aerobic-type carbon monoxide dehydrogenase small subunit (CoxS/CutS family)
MPESLSLRLNGRPVQLNVDGDRRLLWVLRTELGLTGAKYGCGEAHCGACTVLVDGAPVRSCRLRVKDVQDREVVTIEGLEKNGKLHPLQRAFMEHDALQCGFCTPGMIMAAFGLLRTNPRPSEEQIARGMERNLCRCGAHPRIVRAILAAAAEMRGES